MSPFSSKTSFDSSKCVSLLEVTQKRIGILRKKRSIIAKQSREDVATLLGRGQDANAAARADHVYREENIMGAYELLEKHCQLVTKGTNAIKSQKECSAELKEAIASLIYAAPRCGDLQELQKVRDIFASRYGSDYVTAILELRPGCAVNAQVIQKLSSRPPNSDVRLNLLKGIALEYKIEWSYQRAVAASFKNGEASEKAKVSPSVSKQGLTDDAPSPISVDAQPKEPAASLATQSAIPIKASFEKSEFVKTKQSSDVPADPASKDGHKGQASSARQNTAPSIIHDVSPRERDGIGANKSSSIGSPKTVGESTHHDRSKGNASLPTRNSAPSTMNKAEPRKEDFVNTKGVPDAADKQKPSSFFMHRNDERKGHPSSEANKASSSPTTQTRYEDRHARADEHTSLNVEYSAERALDPNRALPSKAKMAPIRSSADARVSESPGVLGGPMQQAASSTPAFDDAKVFALKPEPLSNGESLAAKQYLRAHESYVKVDTAKTREDLGGKGLSQTKFQSKQGASNPQANPPSYNKADVHVESMAVKYYKEHKNVHQQAQDQKSSYNVMNREEVSTINKDYAKGLHLRGTQQEIHGRSRGREGVDRIPSYLHTTHQLEENLSEQQAQDQKSSYKAMNREEVSTINKDYAKGLHVRGTHQEIHGRSRGREGVDRIPSYLHTTHQFEENLSEQQAQDQKSSYKAMNREEVSTINKDYANGHPRGTQQEIYDRSRGREGVDRIPSYSHSRQQLEENLSEHQKYSTIPGRTTPRHSVPSTLRTMKEGVDQELADLEIAIASAARAADAAIDMVRSCSIRSRADKKDHQRERNTQTRKSYGDLYSETGFDARKGSHNTSIVKGDLDHKQPYQEQEPVSLDSEMPHFDLYSSDEEKEPPVYSKGRLPFKSQHVHVEVEKPSNMSAKPTATAFTGRGQHDFSRENRNSQNEMFYDDNCAESVDSYSPKSSSSSHQHSDVYPLHSDVQPSYKSQLDEYEERENVRGRSRVSPFRSNMYAGDEKFSSRRHGIENDRDFDMKLANENADRGVLKWQGSAAMPTGDVGKKKWTLSSNVQPPSQPYKQHDAEATHSGEGKFQGVSRRSVRSLGPT